MKFAAQEDIQATIDQVFAAISDFDGFERAALRRGADVVRTDDLATPGKGMCWKAEFPFRNRQRKADVELTGFEPPNGLQLFALTGGLEVTVLADLVALSRSRTRLNISLDMRPRTIPARLMIQSMKLARSNIAKRFKKRVADFSQDIEDRHKGPLT